MTDGPICRERQFIELETAIEKGVKAILVNGPISSGKSYTLEQICEKLKESYNFAYIHYESGNSIKNLLTAAYYELTQDPKKVSSFASFATQLKDIATQNVVIFDSADLLDDLLPELLKQILAITEIGINCQFIIVIRSPLISYGLLPTRFYLIHFSSYTIPEITQIITSIHPQHKDPRFESFLKRIIQISEPTTRDLRDLIFLSYTIPLDTSTGPTFGQLILDKLIEMRAQQGSRVIQLPRTAAALLLALNIAMKTTVRSDLLSFTRAKTKKAAGKKIENHEYVPFERVLAIAKALIVGHMDGYSPGYALIAELTQLEEMKLVEIKGDKFLDPRLKCLATEEEISFLAEKVGIVLSIYTTES